MARVRTLAFGNQSGTRTRKFTGIVETRTVSKGETTCTDFTGRLTDHPLTIVSRLYSYPTLAGDTGSMASGYIWNGYPTTNGGLATSHLNVVTLEPDDVYSATKVVGDTNPARPAVSVPLLLFESIKELPKMLYDSGVGVITGLEKDLLHKRRKRPSGDSSVSFNFGWNQLYRDVALLFDFTEHVEERITQLNALYSGRGLRRTRTVWTEQVDDIVQPISLQSQGASVSGIRTTRTSYKKWVSTRWKPANELTPTPSSDEIIQNARYLVHGWKLAPIDIWNALPWSWLIDYFSNFGDVLAANRNSNEFRLVSCCIMRKTETRSDVKPISYPSGMTVTPGYSILADKRRVLGSVGISAYVPFLSAQRLLNLLSIANNYGHSK